MTPSPSLPGQQWRRVLVVFTGRADLWWLRLLKPGFRHVFLALCGPHGWLVFDPLSHQSLLHDTGLPPEADLAGYYRGLGLTVIETRIRRAPRRAAPWRPYSCVEAVKRLLGLQAPWVLTPWQLHRFLFLDMRTKQE